MPEGKSIQGRERLGKQNKIKEQTKQTTQHNRHLAEASCNPPPGGAHASRSSSKLLYCLRSQVTKNKVNEAAGLGGTDVAWRAAPPPGSSACVHCQSLRRGLPTAAFSRCRRAPDSRRLTTLLPDLWPRITQCASLLPARCRGKRAQRDDTSEVAPGVGGSRATLPAAMGREPGGRGRGGQLTKGLGFVLEKTTEKDQVRAPHPPPAHMHIQTEVPGAVLSVSELQKSPRRSVFCLIRQYTFHISFLKGLFLISKDPPPGKNTPCWRLLMPSSALEKGRDTVCASEVAVTTISGTFRNSLGFSPSAQPPTPAFHLTQPAPSLPITRASGFLDRKPAASILGNILPVFPAGPPWRLWVTVTERHLNIKYNYTVTKNQISSINPQNRRQLSNLTRA